MVRAGVESCRPSHGVLRLGVACRYGLDRDRTSTHPLSQNASALLRRAAQVLLVDEARFAAISTASSGMVLFAWLF